MIRYGNCEDYQVINMVDSSFDLKYDDHHDEFAEDSLLGDKLEKELRLAVDEFRHNQENALISNQAKKITYESP